jgi:lipid-A-disaccharide synthase
MRAISQRAPQARFTGMGGQAMRSAGLSTVVRSEDLSVMGLTEVLAHLPRIVGLLRRIRRELALRRPDLVVLIDAPDFNFRVARMAHGLGIPVVYYISPQIWAWRQSRVRFIKRYVARVISILPFEQEFYARHGVAITYVGHPLVDATTTDGAHEHCTRPIADRRPARKPAKRARVPRPVFGEAARILLRKHPSLTFHIALAPTVTEAAIRSLWPEDVPVSMVDHSAVCHAPELFRGHGRIRNSDPGERTARDTHHRGLPLLKTDRGHRQAPDQGQVRQPDQPHPG